jgi:PAS domain S-box-containing protein
MAKENQHNHLTEEFFNNSCFRSIADNSLNYIIILDPDNYIIKYVNKFHPAVSPEDVLGKSVFDFIQPECTELYHQKLLEVKETCQTAFIESVGKSSHYPDKKAWYRTQLSVIKGKDGQVEGFIVTAEDITEQKVSELELINKSERIKAIINNTNDIICSIDTNFNITEFNSVFFDMVKRGYQVDLQYGMPILQFIDPTRHEHLVAIYKRALNGEGYTDIQSFKGLSGASMYNETNYNPIYNVDEEVVGINIFSKDITLRIKNEQKIKNALKEKEVLLAEVHHRIKNNLAMVSSLLQLQEMNISNEEAKQALVLSRKRIKSTALIHELLYRSESFQSINIQDYLNELFNYLKIDDTIQLQLNGETVHINLSTALPLGLMLNEIMLNSFKHSYKGAAEGATKIETLLKDNQLFIEYSDCKGQFPEHVDFKKSNTTGLTLIHTFAEQLNGSIELISKMPPKYSIQIPLYEEQ